MNRLILLCGFMLCSVLPVVAQTREHAAPHSFASPVDQVEEKVQPNVSELQIGPDTVSDLHLKPNFATTIRMPEPVAAVVVGAPTLFLAEHSDHDPELVTVKPITSHAATSNLLISTRSGQQVSLRS